MPTDLNEPSGTVVAMSRHAQDTPSSAPRPVHRGRNAAVATGLVVAAAAGGSLATDPKGDWYRGLEKPSWHPPDAAVPIVWTTLYAGIAATSTGVLNELERRGDRDQAAGYTRALGVHLTINGLSSLVYFRWHNLPAATVGDGVLALNSWLLARRAGLVDRKFGLQLTPYALWTSFATALTGSMWSRNPRKS